MSMPLDRSRLSLNISIHGVFVRHEGGACNLGQGRLPQAMQIMLQFSFAFETEDGGCFVQHRYNLVDDEPWSVFFMPSRVLLQIHRFPYVQESEQSVVRGDVPLDQGDYSLSQKAIILQRITSTSGLPPRAPPASIEEDISVPAGLFSQQPAPVVSIPQEGGDQHVDKLPLAKATEAGRGYDDYHGEAIDQQTSDSAKLLTGPRLTEKTKVMRPWRELPEIILFWSRDRRLGGNLIVCPNESMNRLVQAYLVCEVVEHSKKKMWVMESAHLCLFLVIMSVQSFLSVFLTHVWISW